MTARPEPAALRTRGSALLTVLLALALLLSLGVPFLLASRLRSEASRETFDRAQMRLAVGSATRFAMHYQAGTHPAEDPTPLWDAPAEWDPASAGRMPQSLGEEWGIGQSWGFEVENAQARVSLATAPPTLVQNLLRPCFTTQEVELADGEIKVNSTAGFPETGMLMVRSRREMLWAQYTSLDGRMFQGVSYTPVTGVDPSGAGLEEGFAVVDARVFGMNLARIQGSEFQPPEFLFDLFGTDVTGLGVLPAAEQLRLERLCSLESGAYGAPDWEPGVWLTQPVDPENPNFASVTDVAAFAPGTIARITPEDAASFDALVLQARGGLTFATPLPLDLEPGATIFRPLRREPVDLNAARPEVVEALVAGLRWVRVPPLPQEALVGGSRRSSWVSPGKAREFAALVVGARPLKGPDDLWARVLEPMVRTGKLDHLEALAIHANGIDPNNGYLEQTTLPFGYRSGDRYLQRVNALVRSRIGRTLARGAQRQSVRPAPDGPLLRLWRTQVDFDDVSRWGRSAHGADFLPHNLGAWPGHHDGFSALPLRTGLLPLTGRMIPEDREEDSAVMPRPAYEGMNFGAGNATGKLQHFEAENSPLGYDPRERGARVEPVDEWGLGGGAGFSSIEPLYFQGWFETLGGTADGFLFDLAGPQLDRSRVYAAFEQGKLVVRAFDNAGDDPADPDGLVQAVEVEIDPAEYPMDDRWLHVDTLVRGVSPRGVQVAVDGVPRGKVRGLTWLTQAVSGFAPGGADGNLYVESTEGFPARGALIVGGEVMEYSSKTANSFVLDRDTSPNGWLGGRAAREGRDSLAGSVDSVHPVGSAVEQYGYSAVLASIIPPGGGRITGEVGPWSVATLIGGRDSITYTNPLTGQSRTLGTGINCQNGEDLELAPFVDGDTYYAEAFQSDGGYALLYQVRVTPPSGQPILPDDGCRLGGVELIRYSGRQDTKLVGIQRNQVTPGVEQWPAEEYDGSGASYVTTWNLTVNGQSLNNLPQYRVHVIPVSVKGSRVDAVSYLQGLPGFSEFVQLTNDADAGLTEWVRYDSIVQGHFVRDDWNALVAAIGAYLGERDVDNPGGPTNRPAGNEGGEDGGAGQQPGGGYRPCWQDPGDDFTFVRRLGVPTAVDRDIEIERMREALSHRGVMGTYDHAHTTGERLVPVFRTLRGNSGLLGADPFAGYVGRLDRVAVFDQLTLAGASAPPRWYTVQWATPPLEESFRRGGMIQAVPVNPVSYAVTYVAFQEDPGVLLFADPSVYPDLGVPNTDVRTLPRLLKFPSAERPFAIDLVAVGGDSTGISPVFQGHVDEVGVHAPNTIAAPTDALSRGCYQLLQDLDAGETAEFFVHPNAFFVDGRRYLTRGPGQGAGFWLDPLPRSGLLDLDGERIAYSDLDPGTGRFTIAPQGRGLHGTEPRGHAGGTRVWLADGRPASALASAITPNDNALVLDDTARFGGRGLQLIGQELVHTAFKSPGGDALLMPRRRLALDDTRRYGEGLLRGRFGTVAADHSEGELVYSMPCRWEDRWIPQSDDPAGAWLGLSFDEPDAYWRSLRFEVELPDASQRVRATVRSGPAAWEDPEGTPGLRVLDTGTGTGGEAIRLDLRADQLDVRFSFDWETGAFDPVGYTATGWTSAPRIRSVLLDYLAGSRVEWSEEVVE
ncbi:MAG TPA: hypothetical protein VGC54_14340 [Planctomycetota bacterium]